MNIIDDLRAVQVRLGRVGLKIEDVRSRLDDLIQELTGVQSIVREHEKPIHAELSPKEKEILKLLGGGATTQAIAEKLGRSKKTIEAHRDTIRKKLGISNSHELLRLVKEGKI